jgi:riboflavin biosynthesis pyrimidine reductase
MQPPLTRLYPPPEEEFPLQGLYLDHRLQTRGTAGKPFLYSNFIMTLDGRIAVTSPGRSSRMVPQAAANARDWRLYQELAGQADLLITSGRFFRQSATGEAQDILPVSRAAEFTDIHEWRERQGLPEQPDIAILSRTLDIPLASLAGYRNRRIMVITGDAAPAGSIDALQDGGIEVIAAGPGKHAGGSELTALLAERGYHSIYAIAGPGVFHTLVEADCLDRLYLTITHQLLSGTEYDTFTRGSPLAPVRGLRMISLYHDAHAPAGASQWFSVFEPCRE